MDDFIEAYPKTKPLQKFNQGDVSFSKNEVLTVFHPRFLQIPQNCFARFIRNGRGSRVHHYAQRKLDKNSDSINEIYLSRILRE